MIKYIVFILAVSLLSCVSVQKKRLNFIESHPDMTGIQREALLRGEVVSGMTGEMVMIAWGKPRDIVTEEINGRKMIKWYYIKKMNDMISGYEVLFRRDTVMDVRYKGTYSPTDQINILRPFR